MGSEQQGVGVTDRNGQRAAKMWELVCSEWVAGSKIWAASVSIVQYMVLARGIFQTVG